MLNLPQVTLFAIDCVNPNRTLLSMQRSMRWVRFGRSVLLTDLERNEGDLIPEHLRGVALIDHKESDVKRVPCAGTPPIPVDYEQAVLTSGARYLLTPFMLFMEWDSMVVNPAAWTDEFLQYDYIGAPWPNHVEEGWPPCNETNNVGNGGFALKSAAFCAKVCEATQLFAGDPAMLSSDRWQCRTIRPWMEDHGIVYAPEPVAARFSCENRIYSGQFGFHGKNTIKVNGWNIEGIGL